MTPTATVLLLSLTANRPNGGYSEKVSQQNAFWGLINTKAESPFFKESGFSSLVVPVLLSILAISSSNLQAMWEVWQSTIGV